MWNMQFPHRAGLVVRCTLPSLRAEVLGNRLAPMLHAERDWDQRGLLALAEVFAEDSLLGWNLTWGGQPRSADAAGIARLDKALIAEILVNWIEAWNSPSAGEVEADPVDWSELDTLSVDLPAEDEASPELAVVNG